MGIAAPIIKGVYKVGSKAVERYRRSASLRAAVRKTGKEMASWLPDVIPHAIRKSKAIGKAIGMSPAKLGGSSKVTKRWLLGAELGGSIGATGAGIGYEAHLLNKERKERGEAINKFKSSLSKHEKKLGLTSKKLANTARKFKPVRRLKGY